MPTQEIKCSVSTCRYNDHSRMCTLSDIQVGNCESSAHCKEDTECASFEEM